MKILSGEVSCTQPFLQNLLRNYLIRGFNNILMILHSQYMTFLAEAGLSKEFFSFFLKGASAEVEVPEETAKTTINQCEIRLDQMRVQGLTTETSITKATPHHIYVPKSAENALFLVQGSKHAICQRLPIRKILGNEYGKSKVPSELVLKDP